jgi:hypothetical protein
MFDIVTSRDFRAKLEADYVDFQKDIGSARLALNCIITAYHLHEWVWADWLKKDTTTQQTLGLKNKDKSGFADWLESQWPDFKLVKELTNGGKHFRSETDTKKISGFGQGPYGIGPYGHPYLLIFRSNRLTTAHQLINEAAALGYIALPEYVAAQERKVVEQMRGERKR